MSETDTNTLAVEMVVRAPKTGEFGLHLVMVRPDGAMPRVDMCVESPADLTSELFYRRFMKPALYALKEQQAAAQAAQGGEA